MMNAMYRKVIKGISALLKAKATALYAVAFSMLLLIGCTLKTKEHADTFICPMHTTIISDHKGTCPVCGMDLVRKTLENDSTLITDDVTRLLKSPNEVIVGSVKTVKPAFQSSSIAVDAEGLVTYDTKQIYTISSRSAGRLEKVVLKYPFQPVMKGQKIAEIYSPELLAAQRELLYVLNQDAENVLLADAAKHKLELLGLSNSQIDEITKTKKVDATISIFSPYAGYLIDQEQNATSATQSISEMKLSNMAVDINQPETTSSLVREGQYVQSGAMLFRIVSDNAYRIELDLPASQASNIAEGGKLELDFLNGHVHEAKIDFVQPFFSNGQSFIKIRVYTNKMEGLHIGHLVKTKINFATSESIWVPRSAVIYLGNESIVFRKINGLFKPHKVELGNTSGDSQQITKGLATSDEIAANAQFLVDSESFIKSDNK